jgi:myo-inositol 2-dehydrogenase/D-chiro-inositol 1-dehydrogenase
LNDKDVDAVMVTSPTETHEHYVRKSLSAGLGVFCEKPIAANLESVAACYEEAERVQKPLLCAFNRRFDPAMSNVYRNIKEGKLGRLYKVKTCSRDGEFPSISYLKISSGIYHDSAIHDIDMICWIVGEAPVGVMAVGSAFHSEVEAIGDCDMVAVNLKFPSGVLGYIDLSRHSNFGYDQRLEVSSNSLLNMKYPIIINCGFLEHVTG